VAKSRNPRTYNIFVLAGTNGAGKSSIAGSRFVAEGTVFFNPDEATLRIRTQNPTISLAEANSAAWQQGRRLLERAIAERSDFAFETTLGGNTISGLLGQAIAEGAKVRIAYVGLESVALHVERVRSRVAAGGHNIPEGKIRQRYDQSRLNVIRLLPGLAEFRLYDNSAEADPKTGKMPKPKLIIHTLRGRVVRQSSAAEVPEWCKAIFVQALKSVS
jgi:predicted ABC-type ATPase